MQNNRSSYSRWSWIIALILALILLWMLLTGKGPSNACCAAEAETTPVAEVMPTEATMATDPFKFSATENGFSSTGDASSVTWAGDSIDALKALLTGGISADGDDKEVMLSGVVDSDEVRQQKGYDAQTYFGPDVTIDNQITVAEPAALVPAAAKLYFDTGVHRLPADSATTLAPVITWLNENPSAKAVISGFHDHTGSVASNIVLAKKRAKSAYRALAEAGIAEDRIELRKPESTTGDGDLSEARRVEVSIE